MSPSTPLLPDPSAPCPCGSGDAVGACCGPVLADARPAPAALQLMRSRYVAFAVRDAAHLLRSWHPTTRPGAEELEASLAEGLAWRRLVVHRTERGGPFDDDGIVEFTALARATDGSAVRLHETSRFVREHGRWLYVDGDVAD